MLKITVHETPQQITLKLEGSLTGGWVMELEECWRAASSRPTGRLLCLDLTDVCSVDSAGTYLLALLHNLGVQLIASGLVMTELVAHIEKQWQPRNNA
jgi:ABC-type transporter Mla MlaB component